ncbi:hypothetical protein F4780DRAFT_794405 [Xylariomycetidae sp. FL0641]|nr:hypothetical protein F4780DRAFT_794405 [Xylariomycetidae sp. FL0641]
MCGISPRKFLCAEKKRPEPEILPFFLPLKINPDPAPHAIAPRTPAHALPMRRLHLRDNLREDLDRRLAQRAGHAPLLLPLLLLLLLFLGPPRGPRSPPPPPGALLGLTHAPRDLGPAPHHHQGQQHAGGQRGRERRRRRQPRLVALRLAVLVLVLVVVLDERRRRVHRCGRGPAGRDEQRQAARHRRGLRPPGQVVRGGGRRGRGEGAGRVVGGRGHGRRRAEEVFQAQGGLGAAGRRRRVEGAGGAGGVGAGAGRGAGGVVVVVGGLFGRGGRRRPVVGRGQVAQDGVDALRRAVPGRVGAVPGVRVRQRAVQRLDGVDQHRVQVLGQQQGGLAHPGGGVLLGEDGGGHLGCGDGWCGG